MFRRHQHAPQLQATKSNPDLVFRKTTGKKQRTGEVVREQSAGVRVSGSHDQNDVKNTYFLAIKPPKTREWFVEQS